MLKGNNSGKKITLLAVILVIVVLFVFIIRIFLIDSAKYTRSNWAYYALLTPEVIKKSPLISDNYSIHYDAQDGNKPEANVITFYNVNDAKQLREYLLSSNYKLEGMTEFGEEWRPQGRTGYVVYLNIYHAPDEVVMAVMGVD